MAGITISATGFSGNLKAAYDPIFATAFSLEPGFYKNLPELAGYQATGSGYTFMVKIRPDQGGLAAVAESGALPTAGNINYQQGSATCKYIYKMIETTGPAQARTNKGEKGSWVDSLADEIETSTQMMVWDLGCQIWRAGTGKITETNGSGTSSTSMIVDSCRHLREGMNIEVYTSGGVAEIATVVISKINYQTRTLTLASAQTWSDGSYVYRNGQYNSGTGLELMGLDGIVGNAASTFEGIDASVYGEWTSYIESNAGDIDRDSLWNAISATEMVSGAIVDQIWCNDAQRQKIFMIVQSQINYQRPENLEVAFVEEDDPIQYGGKVIMRDNKCPNGKIFGLSTGSDVLGTITEKPLGIGTALDEVDSTFLRTSGYDAYTAFLSIYQNVATKNRRAFWKIEGLNDLYAL